MHFLGPGLTLQQRLEAWWRHSTVRSFALFLCKPFRSQMSFDEARSQMLADYGSDWAEERYYEGGRTQEEDAFEHQRAIFLDDGFWGRVRFHWRNSRVCSWLGRRLPWWVRRDRLTWEPPGWESVRLSDEELIAVENLRVDEDIRREVALGFPEDLSFWGRAEAWRHHLRGKEFLWSGWKLPQDEDPATFCLEDELPRFRRIIPPFTMIDCMFEPRRLNVFLDDDGKVADVSLG